MCVVIANSKPNLSAAPRVLTEDEAKHTVDRFRRASFCRIGCNHGKAVRAYVAFQEANGVAIVSDYLAAPNIHCGAVTSDDIRLDLESVAVSVFYDCPQVNEMRAQRAAVNEADIVFRRETMAT